MNHFLAQCLWYPACAIFLIASIKGLKKDKTTLWGDARLDLLGIWGWYSLIPLFLSIFVFNYYSIDYYWKWVLFVLIFVQLKIGRQTKKDFAFTFPPSDFIESDMFS